MPRFRAKIIGSCYFEAAGILRGPVPDFARPGWQEKPKNSRSGFGFHDETAVKVTADRPVFIVKRTYLCLLYANRGILRSGDRSGDLRPAAHGLSLSAV